MTDGTQAAIRAALRSAREKHPRWPGGFEAVSIVVEEVGEMAQAVNEHEAQRAREEALDAIVTLVRFIEGE